MSVTILHGDCVEVMRGMADCSVDSIVCDPPYGLGFMGKEWDTPGALVNRKADKSQKWDHIGGNHNPVNSADAARTRRVEGQKFQVWCADWAGEALRVLKPGGHILAFSGTRTYHRMTVAIEDAGFEVRDQIGWLYGCLDEQTEVATVDGVKPYHKTKVGDLVLCYNAEHGEYSFQPILEVVEYDYSDTAYRLVGDSFEQVVSRNHRCLVERDGVEAFQFAETLQRQARVPVLESLSALQQAIHDAQQDAGAAQQDLQCLVHEGADWCGQLGGNAAGSQEGSAGCVRCVRRSCVEAGSLVAQSGAPHLQQEVQRGLARAGVGKACSHGPCGLEPGIGVLSQGPHDGAEQPCVEGWVDVPQAEGRVCGSADQVRPLPAGSDVDGAQGWLCNAAPPSGGAGDRASADASGSGSPHQPRCDGQQAEQLDAVSHECGAQGIRAWGGHRSAVVRVVPFHYTGKVWCLRVPTGAFVAVRNGVAFPTGNSGFPKSHNGPWGGTALKPAWEPICMARKPLDGTVEANWRAHGTGALNIDGCRVDAGADYSDLQVTQGGKTRFTQDGANHARASQFAPAAGRWPANICHDGSDEVLAAFPQTASHGGGASYSAIWGGADDVRRIGKGDTGSAARFFYCAKASKKDRDEGLDEFAMQVADPYAQHRGRRMPEGSDRIDGKPAAQGRNVHPTVKPTTLMRHLVRLVTPPGGLVLDPFAGSGSTGKAAVLEGFRFIGIEQSAEYVEIAKARIAHAQREAGAIVSNEFVPLAAEKPEQALERDMQTLDLFNEGAA